MTATSFQASLRRAGRPMALKRRIGTSAAFHTATIPGKDRFYQPAELVDGVVQGDRRIRIAAADLAAAETAGDWPGGPPRPGATDTLDGGRIMGVQPLHDGARLVGWVCWVRG
jgi:hypothetical protein